MKLYPSWFLFFWTSLFGFFLVLSSSNWFICWFGFDFSLLGFLPLVIVNSLSVEGMMKYFFVQASGSVLFLMSFLVVLSDFSIILLIGSFLLKLGLFPFFYWVPMVMSTLNWSTCLVLVTVQKLGPLLALFLIDFSGSFMFYLFCSLSVLFSGLMGYNQSVLRPLMAYSSISHTGWLCISIFLNFWIFVFYLFVYYSVSFCLFLILELDNTNKVVDNSQHDNNSLLANFLMITLVGIPPFSIFYVKLMIFMGLSSYFFFVFFLLIGSFFSSYYYLNFIIPNFVKANLKLSEFGVFGKLGMLSAVGFMFPWIMLL